MTLVEMYSKRDCHLCDVAKEVVQRVGRRHPFELNLVELEEGDLLFERYTERVPVVYINGKFAFQFHVPEEEFIAALHAASDVPQQQR